MKKNFFIFFVLIGTSCVVSAQKSGQKTPTMKESVGELKESVKAIGNLFKKKEKNTGAKQGERDTVKIASTESTAVASIPSTPAVASDTTLPSLIKEMIVAHCIKNYSKDKPKVVRNEDAAYVGLEFDFGDGIRNSVYFSTLKKENVLGDLNNDGKEDAIVKVYSNTGGSSDYLDLYIFTQQENTWKLVLVKASSDEDIKGCKIGQFVPTQILNGLLIGESSCFLDSDPRCCPSLYYKTTLKLANNQLVFIKKEKISKKN